MTFTMKRGDTLPVLEVSLKNADGSAHDLTGSTTWKLYIKTPTAVLTRDLVKVAPDTSGILQYAWQATDWAAGNLPTPPSSYPILELPMEYEVDTLTFPNGSFDTLRIVGDLA